MPRWQKDAFAANMRMVERVKELAAKKGCTAGQLALAWVHAQGSDVFPIPGTKRIKYLEVRWSCCYAWCPVARVLTPGEIFHCACTFPVAGCCDSLLIRFCMTCSCRRMQKLSSSS